MCAKWDHWFWIVPGLGLLSMHLILACILRRAAVSPSIMLARPVRMPRPSHPVCAPPHVRCCSLNHNLPRLGCSRLRWRGRGVGHARQREVGTTERWRCPSKWCTEVSTHYKPCMRVSQASQIPTPHGGRAKPMCMRRRHALDSIICRSNGAGRVFPARYPSKALVPQKGISTLTRHAIPIIRLSTLSH